MNRDITVVLKLYVESAMILLNMVVSVHFG